MEFLFEVVSTWVQVESSSRWFRHGFDLCVRFDYAKKGVRSQDCKGDQNLAEALPKEAYGFMRMVVRGLLDNDSYGSLGYFAEPVQRAMELFPPFVPATAKVTLKEAAGTSPVYAAIPSKHQYFEAG